MESPDIQNQISPIMYLPNTKCRSNRSFSSYRLVGMMKTGKSHAGDVALDDTNRKKINRSF